MNAVVVMIGVITPRWKLSEETKFLLREKNK
jgi:hypothetical protein